MGPAATTLEKEVCVKSLRMKKMGLGDMFSLGEGSELTTWEIELKQAQTSASALQPYTFIFSSTIFLKSIICEAAKPARTLIEVKMIGKGHH